MTTELQASADIAALQQQSLDEGDVRATGHRGVVAGGWKTAECIAIEMEMATRIHRQPALADAKFAQMAASIREIMPWFETFLELLRTEEEREAA